MCDHNLFCGQGEDGYFTVGWNFICRPLGQGGLLAAGLEITASFLFQWRTRWNSHETSESLLTEKVMITLRWMVGKHNGEERKRFLSGPLDTKFREVLDILDVVDTLVQEQIENKESRDGLYFVIIVIYLAKRSDFRYKKDSLSSRHSDGGEVGGRGHVHGGGGGGGLIGSGGGEERGGWLEELAGAVVVGRGVLEQTEDFLQGLELSRRGAGAQLHRSQMMAVNGHRLEEAIFLEEETLPPDVFIMGGLVSGDTDPDRGHPLLVDELRGKQPVVGGQLVGSVKPGKERGNGLIKEVFRIYRIRMGEVGFLFKRQTRDTSEMGNTKLNFLLKMAIVLAIRSSMPFRGVRPRPESMTTLERILNSFRQDLRKGLLPKGFLSFQIEKSNLAVLLVCIDLLVKGGVVVGEGLNFLGEGFQGRHGINLKIFLDSHGSRCQGEYHRLGWILTDQSHGIVVSLVGGGHEGKKDDFRGKKRRKKTNEVCICIYTHCFYFIIVE